MHKSHKKAASVAMAFLMTASMVSAQTVPMISSVANVLTASAAVNVNNLESPYQDGAFVLSVETLTTLFNSGFPSGVTPTASDCSFTVSVIDGNKENVISSWSGLPTSNVLTTYDADKTYLVRITTNDGTRTGSIGYKWTRFNRWTSFYSHSFVNEKGDTFTKGKLTLTKTSSGSMENRVLFKSGVTEAVSDGMTCSLTGSNGSFSGADGVYAVDADGTFGNAWSAEHEFDAVQTGKCIYNMRSVVNGGFLAGSGPVLNEGYVTVSSSKNGMNSSSYYASYYLLDDGYGIDGNKSLTDAVKMPDNLKQINIYKDGAVLKKVSGLDFTNPNLAGTANILVEDDNADSVYHIAVVFSDSSTRWYELNKETGAWIRTETTGTGCAVSDADDWSDIRQRKLTVPADETSYTVSVNRDAFPDESAEGYFFIGTKTNKRTTFTVGDFLAGNVQIDIGDINATSVKGIRFVYDNTSDAVYYLMGTKPVFNSATGSRAELGNMQEQMTSVNVNTGDVLLVTGVNSSGISVSRTITAASSTVDIPVNDIVSGYVYNTTRNLFTEISNGLPVNGSYELVSATSSNKAVPSDGRAGDIVIVEGTDTSGSHVQRVITLNVAKQPIPVGNIQSGVVMNKTASIYAIIVNNESETAVMKDGVKTGTEFKIRTANKTRMLVSADILAGDTVSIEGVNANGETVQREIITVDENQKMPTADIVKGTIVNKTRGLSDTISDGYPIPTAVDDKGYPVYRSVFNLKDTSDTNTLVQCNGFAGQVLVIDGVNASGQVVHTDITLQENSQLIPTGSVAYGTVLNTTTGYYDIIVNGQPDNGTVFNVLRPDGNNKAIASNGRKGDSVTIEYTDADGSKKTRQMYLSYDGQALPCADITDGLVINTTTKLFDVIRSGKPDSGSSFNIAEKQNIDGRYRFLTLGNKEIKGESVFASGKSYYDIKNFQSDFNLTDSEYESIRKSTYGSLMIEITPGTTNSYPSGTYNTQTKLLAYQFYWYDANTAGHNDNISKSKNGTVRYYQIVSQVQGDVNQDGRFSTTDIVILNKYLLGKYMFKMSNFYGADVNRDGKVNIFDKVMITRLALNAGMELIVDETQPTESEAEWTPGVHMETQPNTELTETTEKESDSADSQRETTTDPVEPKQ